MLVDGRADVSTLRDYGVGVYEYVPGYGYIAYVPEGTKLPFKTSPVPVELKVSRAIFEGHLEDAIYSGRVRLIISGFPGENPAHLLDLLTARGFVPEEFKDPEIPRYKIYVSPQDVLSVALDLAKSPHVSSVEPDFRMYFYNQNTRWSIQTHVAGDSLVWENGITGEGEIGGVMDTGLDYYSCFFRDTTVITPGPAHRKVIAYHVLSSYADDFATCDLSHGTHVSGTFLGYPDTTASLYHRFKGMAYGAKVVFGDVGSPSCGNCNSVCYSSTLYDILTNYFYPDGARVINMSFGSPWNSYTSSARDVDRFMWDYPDALVVVAAGNNSSDGAYEDRTLGSPATAKNVLSVGATGPFNVSGGYDEYRAYYSSQGPAYDGRIKPEVMTPGGDYRWGFITSAKNRTDRTPSCRVTGYSFQGTSMAAPAAAGAALLVRQYFRDGFYPSGQATPSDAFTPQGSLLKAMLILAAEPLANEPPPPNGEVGFGRINLSKAMYFRNAPPEYKHRLFVVDDTVGISQGDTAVFHVDLGCSESVMTDYVKVVLSWTDAPGAYLQNDLDLIVISPEGLVFKGNVMDTNGVSTPNPTSRDYTNPTEVVYVSPARRGTWTIKVAGVALNNPKPGGTQPYSLVAADAGPCGNEQTLEFGEMTKPRNRTLPYLLSGNTLTFQRNSSLYDASGRLLGRFKAGKEVSLRTGIYFVVSGGKVHKVVVR